MIRVALGIEYHGHGYYGWQFQQDKITIQGELEKALNLIANETIFLHCAGRTDANVHASYQVVHFDTNARRHVDAWLWGTNSHLPNNIVVKWARQVDYKFHARFSAVSRRYRYIIYNSPIRPAILAHRVTWCYYPLNMGLMNEAAQFLLGEQNFNSFRSSKCNSKTPMRRVIDVQFKQKNEFIYFEIEANAFLHHMVRNIVGVLLKIGAGKKPVSWLKEVLAAQTRQSAAETAAPDGLYLIDVKYPEGYSLPVSNANFLI